MGSILAKHAQESIPSQHRPLPPSSMQARHQTYSAEFLQSINVQEENCSSVSKTLSLAGCKLSVNQGMILALRVIWEHEFQQIPVKNHKWPKAKSLYKYFHTSWPFEKPVVLFTSWTNTKTVFTGLSKVSRHPDTRLTLVQGALCAPEQQNGCFGVFLSPSCQSPCRIDEFAPCWKATFHFGFGHTGSKFDGFQLFG